MEGESRIGAFFSGILERITEQAWFQQIKAKWEELDARTQSFIQLGTIGGGVLFLLIGALVLISGARSTRQELADKLELLNLLESANTEMRELRTAGGAPMSPGEEVNWAGYFATTAANSGIPSENLTVSDPKDGAGMDSASEVLFDLSVKDINARQLARYAFFLENGGRPVKLRHMAVDTNEDLSGFLSATFSVSAFSPKE